MMQKTNNYIKNYWKVSSSPIHIAEQYDFSLK